MSNPLTVLPDNYASLVEIVLEAPDTGGEKYYKRGVSYVNPFTGTEHHITRYYYWNQQSVYWQVNTEGFELFTEGELAYKTWVNLCLTV
jgi:hypothetical protein